MERHRIASSVSFLVAFGIIFAGVFGPLALGTIVFRLPEMLVNQYVGGEIVTLLIAAPALVIAGYLWRQGDRLGPALAIGPAGYTVYTFITAIIGQEYARYDGNAEKAFPLYAALILGGGVVALLALADLLQQDAPDPPEGLRKITAGLFLGIAAFFALAWSGQIARVYQGDIPSEYVEGPTLFWLIKLMDLSFLLPLFAITGIGVLRRHPLALRLSYGMVSYAVCMVAAILGMAIAMVVEDDPAGSVGMIAFLTPVAAMFAGIAWRLLALYRHGRGAREEHLILTAPLGQGHAR